MCQRPQSKGFDRFKTLHFLMGFSYGAAITYGLYYLFTTQFLIHPTVCKWTFTVVGVLLSFICSYSKAIRCTILLILPNFFTKRGRTALLAYAFVLCLTGPTKNIALNMEVVGHSLACAEEELKEALNDILTVIKTPIAAIKQAIVRVLQNIKEAVTKVKRIVMKLISLVRKILNILGNAFAWLHKIVNVCNTKIGTPFQRCQKIFIDSYNDCKDTLGPMSFMCGNIDNAKIICYSVKIFDHICSALDTVNEQIVTTVKDGLQDYYDSIKNIFYVSVQIDHEYFFKTKSSKDFETVLSDMLNEIDKKIDRVLKYFKLSITLGMIFFVWMVIKAERYRRKYLKNDRFDNIYITKTVLELEKIYVSAKREPVLPLKPHERQKYIKLTSFRIAKPERFKLFKALSMLMVTTTQILIILATDYSLFWMLFMVRHYGRKIDANQDTDTQAVHIGGGGILAEMCEGIVHAFNPFAKVSTVDTVPCLPNPVEPDYRMYKKISGLLTLLWLTLLLEPFVLRIRQTILSYFYPERSEERAIWLYNEITSNRNLFLKFARKKARQKYLKDKAGLHGYDLPWLRLRNFMKRMFSVFKEKCTLCANSNSNLVECVRPNCKGKYCFDCYDQLNGTCPLCMDPVTYNDFSDYSEEWGSTDEEDYHVARYLNRTNSRIIKDEKLHMKLS